MKIGVLINYVYLILLFHIYVYMYTSNNCSILYLLYENWCINKLYAFNTFVLYICTYVQIKQLLDIISLISTYLY